MSHDACRGRTEIQAQFLLLSMITHPPGNLIWLLSVPWLGWCLDKLHVGICVHYIAFIRMCM